MVRSADWRGDRLEMRGEGKWTVNGLRSLGNLRTRLRIGEGGE